MYYKIIYVSLLHFIERIYQNIQVYTFMIYTKLKVAIVRFNICDSEHSIWKD